MAETTPPVPPSDPQPVASPAPGSTGAPVPLATGPLGMELLGFLRDEPEGAVVGGVPVRYALVALWWRERLLMVRVRGRDCWELPGGGLEPGETPRQAAVRELREETGQTVGPERLRFAGFARTALGPERRVLHGAVYTAELAASEEPAVFVPNGEIAAVHWREGDEPLEGGRVQTVDAYLAALCRP